MSGVGFDVLGPLEAVRDSTPLTLGGPKPQAVLALLLLGHGRTVRSGQLVDALWGGTPPATAVKTVQKYISLLRAAIGEDGLLVTRGDGYALLTEPEQVDARRFEQAVNEVTDATAPAHAAARLEQALALWRGEPFSELGDLPAAVAERTRLEERRLEAIEALTDAQLALGDHTQLVARLEELVAAHPLRERFWGQLMLALYRCGRQADALDAYRRLRASLAEQLGIDPSLPLRQLEERLLRQDPTLDPSAGSAAGAGEAPASNLPARLSSFIGRKTELAELDGLLADRRLVTLLGPAGSGKTRLALELVARVRHRYHDDGWLVELAPLTASEQVATTVSAVFGLAEQPDRSPTELAAGHLRGKQLLLVVDNCEHLVGDAAALVSNLLRAADGLAVLATSREPLGVAGEVTYEVAPLPVPSDEARGIERYDAVQLLVERARAADPHFALTHGNARAVARICQRLDGMPLALELAAARLRAFDPEQLATLLDDRFEVLVSALRGGPARHQTLRAAVDWSHDLLSTGEQTLFRRLSVFAGGFDLDAVERVCGTDPHRPRDVLALLPSLVDRSLVVAEHVPVGGTRYRLLETLKEYGHERMEAVEAEEMRRRHAAHFLERAEEMAASAQGGQREEWMTSLRRDHDNLRAALRWSFSHDHRTGVRLASALETYWDGLGQRIEGAQWLRRAVDVSDKMGQELRLATHVAASNLLHTSDMPRSIALAEAALVQARELGDETWIARALQQLGWSHGRLGQHEQAVERFEEALAIFRSLGDRSQEADCLRGLGETVDGSDPDAAVAHFEEALAISRALDDQRGIADGLFILAANRVSADQDLERAAGWLEESLAISERLGSAHAIAHARSRLGLIARRHGQPDAAHELLSTCLERFREIGDQRCASRMLGALGLMAGESGERDRAAELLEESLALARGAGALRVVVESLDGLAQLAQHADDADRAIVLYAAADQLCRLHELAMPTSTTRTRRERIERVREQLTPEDFEDARARAASMTRDEIIDWALTHSVRSTPAGA